VRKKACAAVVVIIDTVNNERQFPHSLDSLIRLYDQLSSSSFSRILIQPLVVLVLVIAHLAQLTHLYRKGKGRMNMLGRPIRPVKLRLRLYLFGGIFMLPALLLLDLIPLRRVRAFSTTPTIGSWTLTPQPTARGGTWRRTALFESPDTNENENNQTGNTNAGNENEINERSKNNNIKKVESASHSLFQLDLDLDPTLLVPDLLGVAVACELLGLLDAVNEPSFLQNGGWLQSAGGVPTTLPLLISRFSTNSVFWIASCFAISKYTSGKENDGVISNDNDSKSNTKDTSNAMASGQSAVGYALRIGALFCILRIALTLAVAVAVAVATAGATGWDSSTTATIDALLGVLRECYVVVLVTAATRYVVQALYY
jgi:hypothetical protein